MKKQELKRNIETGTKKEYRNRNLKEMKKQELERNEETGAEKEYRIRN